MSDLINRQGSSSCTHEDVTISRQAAIDAIEKHSCNTQRMIDAVKVLPPVDAVPVEWIEKKIEWLVGLDNAFSGLAASSLRAMLASWRKENGDE